MTEKKTVLIIEDDQDIRDLISDILTENDFNVVACENGKVGLDYLLANLNKNHPDCIIIDLMMPVMNGLQVIDYLLDNHENDLGAIPIIITSAKDQPEENIMLLPSNIIQVKKPMEVEELLSNVKRQMGL